MVRKLMMFLLLCCSVSVFIEGKASKKFNIAVIYSYKGKGDKSLNDSAYSGLMKAKRDFGIEVREFDQKISVLDGEYQIRSLVKGGKYDLIIGIPKETKISIEKMAKEYPEQKFLVVNEKLEKPLPNVAVATFREEEGGFLAGVLSAMMTNTYSVGFIGSTGTESVKKYESGFKQGAKYMKKDIVTVSAYIDRESENPYFDIDTAKKLTENLIKKNKIGAVFHNAGGSGIGVLNAAQENGIHAVSSGQEEDKLALGTVLMSITTDLSVPIYQVIKDLKNGSFKGKEYSFGLSENAIRHTRFPYSADKIGKDNIKKLENIKEMIIRKEIRINNR